MVLAHQLSEDRGREALEDYGDMPITRYPSLPLMSRIWRLKQKVTAFDATYIALAEALDAPLITSDGALASSAGHRARVDVYS